jgi:hypothetical protein
VSERGVFGVDRGLFDHHAFKRQTFTQREAWLWIISEAAFRSHRRRIGSVVVDLLPGQAAASLRFMAEKWGWTEPTVRRFLKHLHNLQMIAVTTDAGVTVITIVNYTKYQRVSLPKDAWTDAANDAGPTQSRRKVENTEYSESQKDSEANASGAIAPTDPSPAERDYFRRGREILGNQAGGQLAKLLKAKGGNVALARAAVESASQKQIPSEYVAAAIRRPSTHGPPPGKGGFANILIRKHQERKNEQADSEQDEPATRWLSGN